MKNLTKIGVQIELPEAIFNEVAKVATNIEEAIKLAQEVFNRLPHIWKEAIWERMGDGEDLSIYGMCAERQQSDLFFNSHFAEIFAKKYNIWDRESFIYYTINSNYQKKVIELTNNIVLFPMLGDYEMPADEVESIKIN
jgi:hypothetical protein